MKIENIFKSKRRGHVGRPSNKELKKRKVIKIIIALIMILSLGGGIYLYSNREFIDFSSIFGNSSTYNEAIKKMQTDNSIKTITFNPDEKKKVNGEWFFLEYKHPNGNNIFDYFYKQAGHNTGRYTKNKVEVYYNGKLIKTFKNSSKYFYVKQNWAGKTVVLKTIGVYSGNKKVSKYVKVYIPSALKLSTAKVNNKHYYIVKNASAFYKHEQKEKFYQDVNPDWHDANLAFSYIYANAIKINDFTIIDNQTKYLEENEARLKDISFKRNESNDKKAVIKAIYKQIAKNKPVVLQVNGNTSGTSRHYVVVIGYQIDFDMNNMKENDLLILDVWDGKAEIMSGKGSGTRFMIKGTDTGRDYGYQIYTIK